MRPCLVPSGFPVTRLKSGEGCFDVRLLRQTDMLMFARSSHQNRGYDSKVISKGH